MVNLVWRRFVAIQMPEWVEWFKNHHVPSHIDLIQKFIITHPYFVPHAEVVEKYANENGFLDSLLMNKEFLDTLSDKGCEVWYNSTFSDFVNEIRPYREAYRDFQYIINLFDKYLWWFDRVYAYARRDLAEYLEEEGRTFK